MEVAMVKVVAEVMVVLMAREQIARMDISNFFIGKSKKKLLKKERSAWSDWIRNYFY